MRSAILRQLATGLAAAYMVCAVAPAKAQATLPSEVASSIRQAYGDGEIRTFDRAVDLDGDGRPEIVVYLVGPMVCGTGGCTLLVFTPTGAGYRRVADVSVTRPPIRASSAKSSGWRNLIVHIGGGGAASADVELAFDGRAYPRNPTVPGPRVRPATELAGTDLLIDDFRSMKEGRPLAAADSSPAHALQSTAQRACLDERERCATEPDPKGCVASAYQRRIVELQLRSGDLGPVPPTVAYQCPGLEGIPVTAVYYNQTEPPAAVITVGDRQVIAFIARSGSGARYTAAGVELWEHHGKATLKWSGKTYTCKAP